MDNYIDNQRRLEIYHYFDENGIKGYHMVAAGFTIDKELGKIEKKRPEFLFAPRIGNFGLTDQEANEIILDYIFDTTNVRLDNVNKITNMRSLNHKPFILLLNEHQYNDTKYCIAFGKIPGSVIFRSNDNIDSLGYIEEVLGDLVFSNSKITDLGKLKKVQGNFWISQYYYTSKLKSLSELKYVGQDLGLKYTEVTDLGNLEYVGGNLNLRNTNVINFGNLKFIGDNLLFPSRLKESINLDGINIKGKIRYFKDSEIPFKEVEVVG